MSQITLVDCAPQTGDFEQDLISGLSETPKTLPCKYFYDRRGSELFEQICELDEYYPTRSEISILRQHGSEIAATIGSGCALIEFGSGSGLKTEVLLSKLSDPAAYVPVDISREHLKLAATDLSRKFPDLDVVPVCADFTDEFHIPPERLNGSPRTVYFSGSTIGNFEHSDAIELLQRIAQLCESGGGLLIGVDLQKDRAVLEAAYDDSEGVTRDFNHNLLRRANAELGADFDLSQFDHLARYDEQHDRIEMHLVSRSDQQVTVADQTFEFTEGETIHTENSHKFTLQGFAEVAAQAGFHVRSVWTDPNEYFSVQYLVVDD